MVCVTWWEKFSQYGSTVKWDMNFLLRPEFESSASFSDDTSLPHVGTRVSIHAQIPRESRMDWFRKFHSWFPSDRAELKSPRAIEKFFSLSRHEQDEMFLTLKEVALHICDPRPYQRAYDDVLNGSERMRKVMSLLDEPVHAERKTWLNSLRATVVANSMSGDSPSRRIQRMIRSLHPEGILSLRFDWGETCSDETDTETRSLMENIESSAFQKEAKSIIKKTSVKLSKSSVVLHLALNELESLLSAEHSMQGSYFRTVAMLAAPLRQEHAFDDGDDVSVSWVQEDRSRLFGSIDRFGWCRTRGANLVQLDSRSSPWIQAADIAAGIGRELWNRNSLSHVVRCFSLVTYNGQKIGERAASEIDSSTQMR